MIQAIPLWMKPNSTFSLTTGYEYFVHKLMHRRIKAAKYNAVLKAVLLGIRDELLNEKHIQLPYGLGSLEIISKKIDTELNDQGQYKRLRIDFGACTKLWAEKYPGVSKENLKYIKDKPIIYHLNEHTDGYYNEIFWHKIGFSNYNNLLYKFTPARHFQRELSKISKLGKIYNTLKKVLK